MKKITLFLALALLFSSACSDSGNSPSKTKELLPTKVGNEWKYVATTGGIGTIRLGKVSELMKIEEKDWFSFVIAPKTQKVIRNAADGVHVLLYNDSTKKEEDFLFYKYPVEEISEYEVNGNQVRLVATDKEVSVPAGTFSCYYFNVMYSDSTRYEEYFAPGIGLIKYVLYSDSAGFRKSITISELESYTIK
ncbi:MAG: hypothetical protein GX121_08945 [Ignavibacteria bacterium]|nr:hypothetical protein [Ignavibacteria bacterium]